MEKCIVHLPVEGVILNDDVDVSLATIGDNWIEPEIQRKSLVHQVILHEKAFTVVYPFLSRMQTNLENCLTSRR